jgi:hypothetical protein
VLGGIGATGVDEFNKESAQRAKSITPKALTGGVFDSESGAVIRTVLEPLARRSGADDKRPYDKRMADALVDVAWQIVRGDDGRMLTIPPTVTFGLPRGPD